jgi:hypothetical protein
LDNISFAILQIIIYEARDEENEDEMQILKLTQFVWGRER